MNARIVEMQPYFEENGCYQLHSKERVIAQHFFMFSQNVLSGEWEGHEEYKAFAMCIGCVHLLCERGPCHLDRCLSLQERSMVFNVVFKWSVLITTLSLHTVTPGAWYMTFSVDLWSLLCNSWYQYFSSFYNMQTYFSSYHGLSWYLTLLHCLNWAVNSHIPLYM